MALVINVNANSKNEIAEKILRLMKEASISYGELAAQTGIPKSALQRYATGTTTKLPLPRLEAIASALGVSAAYLMGWEQLNEGEAPASIKKKPGSQEELLGVYDQLSSRNQGKVLTYSKSLLTKQQLDDEVCEVAAAHDRTDIEITPEGRKHDLDLMNDDSFWE